jgi:hypothetical protein
MTGAHLLSERPHVVSEGLVPMRLRTVAAILTSAVLVLGLAACGGGDDKSAAEPGDPTTSASPGQPTSTAPAWAKKYDESQLAAYRAALARWDEYGARAEPIWSRGKATPAARAFFREYLPSPLWEAEYRQLQDLEKAGITLRGRAKVYWSKPRKISHNGLNVTIEQCIDPTGQTGWQDGKELDRAAWSLTPRLRTVHLSKPDGQDWVIYDQPSAPSKSKPPRCRP